MQTYTILDGFVTIGQCEGIPHPKEKSIIFAPNVWYDLKVGYYLIDSSGKYLELYLDEPIVENGSLIAYKMYYR